jgi:hypothetical protein
MVKFFKSMQRQYQIRKRKYEEEEKDKLFTSFKRIKVDEFCFETVQSTQTITPKHDLFDNNQKTETLVEDALDLELKLYLFQDLINIIREYLNEQEQINATLDSIKIYFFKNAKKHLSLVCSFWEFISKDKNAVQIFKLEKEIPKLFIVKHLGVVNYEMVKRASSILCDYNSIPTNNFANALSQNRILKIFEGCYFWLPYLQSARLTKLKLKFQEEEEKKDKNSFLVIPSSVQNLELLSVTSTATLKKITFSPLSKLNRFKFMAANFKKGRFLSWTELFVNFPQPFNIDKIILEGVILKMNGINGFVDEIQPFSNSLKELHLNYIAINCLIDPHKRQINPDELKCQIRFLTIGQQKKIYEPIHFVLKIFAHLKCQFLTKIQLQIEINESEQENVLTFIKSKFETFPIDVFVEIPETRSRSKKLTLVLQRSNEFKFRHNE